MFRRSSPGGGTSWTSRQLQCLVEFMRLTIWHRWQSLISTIDLLLLGMALCVTNGQTDRQTDTNPVLYVYR